MQTVGTTTYNFASWSDGGTQDHIITVPVGGATYTATYNAVTAPAPLAFVQVNSATPQTNQTQVSVVYTAPQVAGDTNILAIGWNNATSNITSVTDSAGNVYQLAVPTARGNGVSQAIYYAKNIKSAAAGTNTVTVTFNTATPYVDSALWSTAVSISSIRSMSALRRQEPAIRRTVARLQRPPRTNSSSAPERRPAVLGGRQRFHHSCHHFARRRHCRRPVRDRCRELQRHRVPLGFRSVGDAGRDVQGSELVWHRSGAWIATAVGNKLRRETTLGSADRRWCQAGRLDVQGSDRSAGVGSDLRFAFCKIAVGVRKRQRALLLGFEQAHVFDRDRRLPAKDSRSAIWLSENGRTSIAGQRGRAT